MGSAGCGLWVGNGGAAAGAVATADADSRKIGGAAAALVQQEDGIGAIGWAVGKLWPPGSQVDELAAELWISWHRIQYKLWLSMRPTHCVFVAQRPPDRVAATLSAVYPNANATAGMLK